MFSESTGFLHSGCSRSLRGFYTPDILGDYGDSIVGALGRDAPRGCETKTRAVDLGRERVGEGGGECRGRNNIRGFFLCLYACIFGALIGVAQIDKSLKH